MTRQRKSTIAFSSILAGLLAMIGWTTSLPAQVVDEDAAAPKSVDPSHGSGVRFEIAYPEVGVNDGAFDARVYVFLNPEGSKDEPRFGPNWFKPQPFFAKDVQDWKPGETVRIDAEADGFPANLDNLAPGAYRAQAVVRLNPDTAKIGDGEGNLFGPIVEVKVPDIASSSIRLTVNQVVPARQFPESERIKYAEMISPILSQFHGRPIKHKAAVILPQKPTSAKSPAVYIITGFGGDHHSAPRFLEHPGLNFAEDLTRIVLNADCGTGHHVFADSVTNGPRGQALTEEFIPYLEKTFNLVSDPRARLLNGHSSGGWSSLWLQTTYPDFFGGTWSTSPDPVDFRDFQQIDVYASGENMYVDRQGERRPIARLNGQPVLFYDDFCRLEEVIGSGGQLGSFEAVFSPKDSSGRPAKLWDRATGAIDPDTAKAWEAYDIRLNLERNWAALAPKLKGKLHVVMGTVDTFYLEGAVVNLKAALEKLGSDADVQIIPDKDHSDILDRPLAERIDREMKAAVAEFLPGR